MVIALSGKSWRTYQRWCQGRKNTDTYLPVNVRRYLYSHAIVKVNYQPQTVKEVREMTTAHNSQLKGISHFREAAGCSKKESENFKHSDLSTVLNQE